MSNKDNRGINNSKINKEIVKFNKREFKEWIMNNSNNIKNSKYREYSNKSRNN